MSEQKNNTIAAQVARLDERSELILDSINKLQTTVENNQNELYGHIEKTYTSKAEFDPIRKIVYGFVGLILLTIGGMFVSVAVKSSQGTDTAITRPFNPK